MVHLVTRDNLLAALLMQMSGVLQRRPALAPGRPPACFGDRVPLSPPAESNQAPRPAEVN